MMHWFEEQHVAPRIVGEFDDSALMKSFGQAGTGIFPAPELITDQVCRQYGVRPLGKLSGVIESFYAISVERRITHPATLAISRSGASGD